VVRVILRKGEWLEVENSRTGPCAARRSSFIARYCITDDALEGLRAFVASRFDRSDNRAKPLWRLPSRSVPL